MKFQVTVAILLLIVTHTVQSVPCAKRLYNSDSFVCVCNSTYCDTVENVDTVSTDQFYQEFITSKSQYRLSKFKNKFSQQKSNTSELFLTLNRTATYQTINGFGGAVTDATGYNIFKLSVGSLNNFFSSYFNSTGIEFNVLRVPLAGVDFSTRTYTYADTPNDFNLTNFQLQPEDLEWKIPIIKAALKMSRREIKLFGSAWTSPPWTKTNGNYSGKGVLLGDVAGQYYDLWARYYVKFFQAYKKYDINFWGVTAQNEPSDGLIAAFPFNCLGFTPEMQADFIAFNLGPQLEANGFGSIKLMILDDHRLFLPVFPQRLFEHNPNAAKYVSGIAIHWYLDAFVPASVLDKTHMLFPDKFFFGTESCLGQGPQVHVLLGSFVRGEEYAKYIIQNLNHWFTGWTDWNMALDLNGGPNWSNNFVDAPVIVNGHTDEFYKQPMFYVLGHFSKFIQPGSVRVDLLTDNLNKSLSHVAFYDKTTRQTTAVILNQSDHDVEYSIFDTDLNVYINSVIEAHSVKTIVWFN